MARPKKINVEMKVEAVAVIEPKIGHERPAISGVLNGAN